MCLINLAFNYHPDYKLIFIANRDEFYERPTKPAAFWKEDEGVLAGRDMKEGGTWMGITKDGLFAAITNYRDINSIKDDAPSRGMLVRDFLSGDFTPDVFTELLQNSADLYNGYNLIFGKPNELYYFSNVSRELIPIGKGVHGLSNHLLNTPWHKVERSTASFKKIIDKEEFEILELFEVLEDTVPADEKNLPSTGLSHELEKLVSPVFIESEKYGTRAMTLVLVDRLNNVTFIEKSLNIKSKKWDTSFFRFKINHEDHL